MAKTATPSIDVNTGGFVPIPDTERTEVATIGAEAARTEHTETTNGASAPSVVSYGDYAGAGVEDVGANDLLVPFLRVLHYSCPEVEEGGAGFIQGARPGMIMNTATQQIIDGKAGGVFIPAHRDYTFIEWVPRDAGGGFVSVWPSDDPRIGHMRQKQGAFKRLQLDNGNDLVETHSLFGLFVTPDGEVWQCICSFTSTQIKKYKMLMTRLMGLIGNPNPAKRLPIFAYKWHLSTQPEQNKKGKYFGWKFALEGGTPESAKMPPNDELFQQAWEFHKLLRSGVMTANYAGDQEAAAPSTDDSEIPF